MSILEIQYGEHSFVCNLRYRGHAVIGSKGNLIPTGTTLLDGINREPVGNLPDWKVLKEEFIKKMIEKNETIEPNLKWLYTIASGAENYNEQTIELVLSELTYIK